MRTTFLLLLSICLLVACQEQSFSSLEEYKEWVFSDASEYTQEASTDALQFNLLHIPNCIAETEAKKEEGKQLVAFQLKIRAVDPNTDLLLLNLENKAASERIKQLEFKSGSMAVAIIEQDTVSPLFWHYENYRGLKNEVLLHLHFEAPEQLKQDFQVFFDDAIFKSGRHQFSFEKHLINYTPQLKDKTT